MSKRKNKRFADRTGFTRHCWECSHAHGWKNEKAVCEEYGIEVTKYDSPNNVCSVGRICNRYTMGIKVGIR